MSKAVAYNDVICWEKIGRSVTARIDLLVRGIREEILKDSATAELNSKFRIVGSTPSRLIDGDPQFYRILEAKANEWVLIAYGISRDVLAEKDEPKSADSIGTIWTYAIGPFIHEQIPELLLLLAGIGPNDAKRVSVNLAKGCDRIGGNLYTNWQRDLVLEPSRAAIKPTHPIAAPPSGVDFSDTVGKRAAPSPAPTAVAVSEPGDWTIVAEQDYPAAPEKATPLRVTAKGQEIELTLSEPKTPIQIPSDLSPSAEQVASEIPMSAESAPAVPPVRKAKQRSDPERLANIVARKLKSPSGDPMMTVEEAAHALSRSKATIYRRIQEGKLEWSSTRGRILTESVRSLIKPRAE